MPYNGQCIAMYNIAEGAMIRETLETGPPLAGWTMCMIGIGVGMAEPVT